MFVNICSLYGTREPVWPTLRPPCHCVRTLSLLYGQNHSSFNIGLVQALGAVRLQGELIPGEEAVEGGEEVTYSLVQASCHLSVARVRIIPVFRKDTFIDKKFKHK